MSQSIPQKLQDILRGLFVHRHQPLEKVSGEFGSIELFFSARRGFAWTEPAANFTSYVSNLRAIAGVINAYVQRFSSDVDNSDTAYVHHTIYRGHKLTLDFWVYGNMDHEMLVLMADQLARPDADVRSLAHGLMLLTNTKDLDELNEVADLLYGPGRRPR